jgi:hypothetical protein
MTTAPTEGSIDRSSPAARSGVGQIVALVLSWTAVGLPLAWGVAETLRKALALFQ